MRDDLKPANSMSFQSCSWECSGCNVRYEDKPPNEIQGYCHSNGSTTLTMTDFALFNLYYLSSRAGSKDREVV